MKKDVKESKINMQLLGDRVLVRPEEAMKKTASGILIPDAAQKEKATRGTEIEVDDEKLHLIHESDVKAIIK